MELLIRATAVYWFLWVLVRGTGKRSLGELTPLDLLVLIVLGDLVQQGVTQEDMSIVGAAVVATVFVLWTVATDRLTHRSGRLAAFIAGEPAVLVEHGRILVDRLAMERLSIDDLHEAARQQGIESLGRVRFCILETDGKFSFITDDPDGPTAPPDRPVP